MQEFGGFTVKLGNLFKTVFGKEDECMKVLVEGDKRREGDGLDERQRYEKVEDIFDFFGTVGACVVDYCCAISIGVFGDRVGIFLFE